MKLNSFDLNLKNIYVIFLNIYKFSSFSFILNFKLLILDI